MADVASDQSRTDELLEKLKIMFKHLVVEARRTSVKGETIDLTFETAPVEPPATVPEVAQDEATALHVERLSKIEHLFRYAMHKTRATAPMEMENNDRRKEQRLRAVADELTGANGMKRFQEDGLGVTEFLLQRLLDKTAVNSVKPEFSKVLLERKITELHQNGQRGFLKYQNHTLGFAYMKTDTDLMVAVLAEVQAARFVRANEKKLKDEKKKPRAVRKTIVKVEKASE